jgi:uncharacterized membrane protein YdjX (TVP38/TMEM64 family)
LAKHLARLWPLLLIAAAAAAFLFTDLGRWLSLDALREHEAQLKAWTAAHPIASVGAFVLIYAVLVTLYVPAATGLTLAGGFLFGTWLGGGATVVGATFGALGAYGLVRTSLGEPLRRRLEASEGVLQRFAEGARKGAFSYVLSLRLIPVFPFFLVNAAAGVLALPVRAYGLASLIGIVPGTLVYAGVGAGLASLFRRGAEPDLRVIFEPRFLYPLLGLALLSLLPVAVRLLRRKAAR